MYILCRKLQQLCTQYAQKYVDAGPSHMHKHIEAPVLVYINAQIQISGY